MSLGLISKKYLIDIAEAVRVKMGTNSQYSIPQLIDAIESIDGKLSGTIVKSEDNNIGLITDTNLTAIANTIRHKLGNDTLYTPDLMADAILAIVGDTLPDFNLIKESTSITYSGGVNSKSQSGTSSDYNLHFVADDSEAGFHVTNIQNANICGMFNIAIPKDYNYIYIDLESSGRTYAYNLLTLYIRDAFGVTGYYGGNFAGNNLKTVSFCNYNSSAEAINSQPGVTIDTKSQYKLDRQTVIIDVSDISVDMYLGFHQCDNTVTMYSLIATQNLRTD